MSLSVVTSRLQVCRGYACARLLGVVLLAVWLAGNALPGCVSAEPTPTDDADADAWQNATPPPLPEPGTVEPVTPEPNPAAIDPDPEVRVQAFTALRDIYPFITPDSRDPRSPVGAVERFFAALKAEDSQALNRALHPDCAWPRDATPLPAWWSWQRAQLGTVTGMSRWGTKSPPRDPPDAVCVLPAGVVIAAISLRVADGEWRVLDWWHAYLPDDVLPEEYRVVTVRRALSTLPLLTSAERATADVETPASVLQELFAGLAAGRPGEEVVQSRLVSASEREASLPRLLALAPSPQLREPPDALRQRLYRALPLTLIDVRELQRYRIADGPVTFLDVIAVFADASSDIRRAYRVGLQTRGVRLEVAFFELEPVPAAWLQHLSVEGSPTTE